MDQILPSDPGVSAPARRRRLSARAVKRLVHFDQVWRHRATGTEAEVCRIYRNEQRVYLRKGGRMWPVGFTELGARYELVADSAIEGDGAGGDG